MAFAEMLENHAYALRMARVNTTIPDDLLERARERGLNISEITRLGLEAELRRRDNADGLAMLLAEMEADLGAPSAPDEADAEAWARRVYGADSV